MTMTMNAYFPSPEFMLPDQTPLPQQTLLHPYQKKKICPCTLVISLEIVPLLPKTSFLLDFIFCKFCPYLSTKCLLVQLLLFRIRHFFVLNVSLVDVSHFLSQAAVSKEVTSFKYWENGLNYRLHRCLYWKIFACDVSH